jgi:hypothetical protein
MLDRACAGFAFPKTVEKAFAGQICADFVPNFWQVMNPKAKNRRLASVFLQIGKKAALDIKNGRCYF